MTNANSTKRALFASVMAMLLCFTMLLGTTFAWFTDTATSGVNKIVAGNLDIGVYYAYPADVVNGDVPADAWKPLAADKAVFNQDALWEPGYTEAVFFKFANEGSLALQYQFKIDILNEVVGKTLGGDDIQLSDLIQAYACNSFEWDYTNYLFVERDQATDPAGAPNPFHDTLFNAANGAIATPNGDNPLSLDSWQWLEPDETTYATLVLWVPESVGNEANHDGKTIPSIDLGINVLATQYTYESDSFDDQYDKDSEYPVTTVKELTDALAAGKNAVLSKDIADAPVNTKTPYGNYYGIALNGGVLDGNGKTLDFNEGELHNGRLDNYGIMASAGTIKNVNITGVFRGIVIMNPTDDVYIDNVTLGGEDMCYAINTAEGDGTHSLIVTNSTITGWSSYGTAISDLSFTKCTFAQGEYYTDVYGRLVKPYVNTVFDSCEFNSKFYIDLSQLGKDGDGNVLDPTAKITLKNCTVNGVKLTAQNWTSLIASENDCGEGQISIEGKDGSYMTASNILDYVIIQ